MIDAYCHVMHGVGLDVQETGFSNESKPMRAVNHESSGCWMPPHGPGPFSPANVCQKRCQKQRQDLRLVFLRDVFLDGEKGGKLGCKNREKLRCDSKARCPFEEHPPKKAPKGHGMPKPWRDRYLMIPKNPVVCRMADVFFYMPDDGIFFYNKIV